MRCQWGWLLLEAVRVNPLQASPPASEGGWQFLVFPGLWMHHSDLGLGCHSVLPSYMSPLPWARLMKTLVTGLKAHPESRMLSFERSFLPSANSPFLNKVTFMRFRGYDKAIYLEGRWHHSTCYRSKNNSKPETCTEPLWGTCTVLSALSAWLLKVETPPDASTSRTRKPRPSRFNNPPPTSGLTSEASLSTPNRSTVPLEGSPGRGHRAAHRPPSVQDPVFPAPILVLGPGIGLSL